MRNRILVVDDSPYVADASARLIAVCGYETKAVYGGREAIEQVSEFAPDMVLMDIGMPDLDGYEAAAAIRREPRNANVLLVAVTCLNQEQDRQRALDSGFNQHIAKPVSLTTLYGLLRMLHSRTACSHDESVGECLTDSSLSPFWPSRQVEPAVPRPGSS